MRELPPRNRRNYTESKYDTPPRQPRTRPRRKPKGTPVAIRNLEPGTEVRKRGNVYFLLTKTRRKISWKLIICILIIFTGAIGSAYSYAQIHSIERENASLRNQVTNQIIANRNLEAQITRNYSREEIERLAAYRLGMSAPDASQIVYFHLPNQSGVIMSTYSPAPETQENYFWQNIVGFFTGIIDWFTRN